MFSEFARVIVEKLSHINLLTLGLLLLTALGSAVVAYWRTVEQKSFRDFFDFAFPAEVIMHPSARADALFWITKRLVMPFLLIPAGVTFVAATGYATNQAVGWLFSISQPLIPGPAGPVTIILFTATMLVAYDISYYLYHVAQHRFPFLWELHKVHHSAEVMVGITKDRVHPLDDLMNRIWDGVIPGISFGLWSLIALNPVEIAIFGINVYVIRNILMMDFVRHTHLKISFGRLNGVILCPHWHQVHHSVDPRHYDKNFGLLFSFWDRIFGTQFIPDPDEDLKFGLIDRDVRDYQSLFGLYVLPLKKMANHIVRLFQKRIDVARPQDRLQP
ncbi:fatty acid hydroxylase [Mesorhizobium sp. LSJC268A00]|uniref:sterol desaturase family protein n=1 Tax=unclassified Mesorhizobium TaxID=325217 RepID=UPI0003CDD88C|nr:MULTISPECIES: sterol desaturase family protein [unclassified Mesorhizobium]ESX06640.1 fatty acid hydroxylase [Mesorhizobium sp. LSJC268A00]ESX90946.1 fatty acid hydroxylase [Mesorhizobium sp. LSHC412B00]ESZ15957.1 fatty acid hydroxylase [Mesorhizobium sp. L2C085B000]